jgi:glycine cleavage system aminomethyltransferase T
VSGAAEAPVFDPVMRTPLHRQHVKRGATFARDGAWEYAATYAGDADVEGRRAMAHGVGIVDVSARGKIDLRGAIGGLFSRIARTSEGWGPGRIVAIEPAPSEAHPGLIAPISDVWAILFCPPDSVATRLDEMEAPVAEGRTMITEVSSQYSGFALAGPRTFELLSLVTGFDLDALEPGAAVATRLLDITGILLHRRLDGDRTAVEAWVSSSYARYAWESLLSIGARHGGAPAGRDALAELGWW